VVRAGEGPAPRQETAHDQDPKRQGCQPAANPTPTKRDAILNLLTRPNGTSLEEMVAATGWLPHSRSSPVRLVGRVQVQGSTMISCLGERGDRIAYRLRQVRSFEQDKAHGRCKVCDRYVEQAFKG
jgi:hypothetical protein